MNKQQLFDYQNYEKKLFVCLFIFILITRGIHYQSCQYNSLIRQLFVKKVEIPGFLGARAPLGIGHVCMSVIKMLQNCKILLNLVR